VLIDVPRVSEWVSVVGDVAEHEALARYTAVLEDRLGPFKLRADLDVVVTDIVEPQRITIKADGEDRQVGSRITVDATLGLDAIEGGTEVVINGTYEVTGRVATMGASTIRQKASKILDEFISAAQQDLA
jgi:carbon monoxide dehydrogenase subunit G